jgi:hypothetical protein
MFSTSAGCVDKVILVVDGARICPSNMLDLLGVKFNRKFSTAPHIAKVARATVNRASLIKRMLHHIPHLRGQYLRQLALGLVHGKLSHALAAVANPRLLEEVPTNRIDRRIQVSLNNVARTITPTPKTAHVRVTTLLANAKIP